MQFLSRAFYFFIFTIFFVSVSINAVAQSDPPAITSVDHLSMPVGGRQCANGIGFGSFEGNSTFTLNGTVLNTAVSWSDSQFCFQVPAATTPGTATVQLTTTNGTSNGLSFTLTPPPVINDITPARGAPGSQVTITGTNFGATQDNSYIQFDSTAPIVSWSDTQIVFTVPQGTTPGSHTVWLRVDFVITATDFTVSAPPPVLNSLDHASMPVGGRQCVTGTNFGQWQLNSTITLNGTVANSSDGWSDSQFCFRVPYSTPPGPATVQLTTIDGTSNSLSFTLTPPPMINSITPASGEPGSQVMITGTNFGATQGNSYLQFDSTIPVVSWSDTQVVFTVPQGATLGSHSVWLYADFVIAGVDFTVTTISPLLQLSITDTPLQVNLSSPQVLDWIHWGRVSATEPDRKAGVIPQISDYSILNNAPASANSGVVAFSWIDGDHSPLVSETLADVEVSNANGGLQITVPADTTVKTLNLYLEVSGGTGSLQASLSDGSALSITDQSVTDLDFSSKTYSIDFRAASSGQTLTVSFSAVNGATIGLQAATLTSHLPVVAVTSPTAAQQFSAPASVPVNISATQVDAFIANISATGSEGTVLQSSASPFNASWGPLAAGHYSLAATATDTAGLSSGTNPVEIDVIGQGGSLSIEEVVPSSPIDLESQGSADWVLWGPLNTGDSIVDNPGHLLARKSGIAPLISEYKPIGNHPIAASVFAHDLCFNSNQQNYCGSDIAVHDSGNGFEINVAADTTPRTLQLYVGTQSADGKIIAFLSDGSAPVATEIGGSGGGTPNPGNTTLYNIQFAAASPGQTLTVRFTMNSDQGGGQIALLGATLSGNPVAPSVPAPQITSVTPGSAPLDARITINGTNFGANQGAGYVQIGDQAQVVSWSDTAIVAVVPAALQVGRSAEITVFTDHGVSNTASLNILAYNVFPASLNLLVGQSRTLAARDNQGNPVTGLPWSASDPTILSLTTDDPPLITALAPGSAKVWAGDISVPVTVYAGTVLPAGTPNWSLPLGGANSGSLNLVPAVPSDSGADVLALDSSGKLTAVTTDGAIAWSVSRIPQTATTWGSGAITIERSTITPDFSGRALVTSPYTFTQNGGCATHFTHKVSQINAGGQMVDLHVFSDQRLAGVTIGCPESSGVYSDNNTTEVSIPHPSGPVFIQDNATIIEADPSTAATIATVTLDPSTVNGIANSGSLPSGVGKMIVAGDGNAYVPYVFSDTQSNANGNSQSTHTVTHLMVLRMSPDGSNAKTELKTWTQDFNHTQTSDGSCSNCFQESTRGSIGGIIPDAAITNADIGATVFAFDEDTCSDLVHTDTSNQITNCADNHTFSLMTSVLQDSISSQIDHISIAPFVPALQREDGSYVGTGEQSNQLTALSQNGAILWQTNIVDSAGNPISITPLYATADGGVIATSTRTIVTHQDPLNPANQDSTANVISKTLGTLYTLDVSGNTTSQSSDAGSLVSWTGHWYVDPPESISQVSMPQINGFARSLAAFFQGNPSATNVAARPWYFKLVWQNDFSLIPDNPVFLNGLKTDISFQATAIKQAALSAFKKAFSTFPVTADEGAPDTGDQRIEIVKGEHIEPSTGLPVCGLTSSFAPVTNSNVYYETNMEQAQWGINLQINTLQDLRKALANPRLFSGIGAGIGNNGAHEMAHQFLFDGFGMDDNSKNTYNGQGCNGADSPWIYDGTDIHWEQKTFDALKKKLGSGWHR